MGARRINKELASGILLILPPPWGTDVPPLGIACLSSFLQAKGINAELFDFNIELYNALPEKYRNLWSMNYADWWHEEKAYQNVIKTKLNVYIESLIQKILLFPQKIIGLSLPTNCSDLIAGEIISRIKESEPEKIIVLGGVSIL